MLNWIVWNRTVYMYKNLALNNLQWLICHKTKPKSEHVVDHSSMVQEISLELLKP